MSSIPVLLSVTELSQQFWHCYLDREQMTDDIRQRFLAVFGDKKPHIPNVEVDKLFWDGNPELLAADLSESVNVKDAHTITDSTVRTIKANQSCLTHCQFTLEEVIRVLWENATVEDPLGDFNYSELRKKWLLYAIGDYSENTFSISNTKYIDRESQGHIWPVRGGGHLRDWRNTFRVHIFGE